MKSAIVLVALFALTYARPQAPQGRDNSQVEIISFKNEPTDDGGYLLEFALSDGTKRQERGVLKEVQGQDEEGRPIVAKVIVVTGSFEYNDENNEVVQESYTADENGFQAQGNRLPVPPVPQ